MRVIGRKYSDLRGDFLALVFLIIRNKRPNLGTLSCQGGIAEINFSPREHFSENVPQGGPCVGGHACVCVAAPGCFRTYSCIGWLFLNGRAYYSYSERDDCFLVPLISDLAVLGGQSACFIYKFIK